MAGRGDPRERSRAHGGVGGELRLQLVTVTLSGGGAGRRREQRPGQMCGRWGARRVGPHACKSRMRQALFKGPVGPAAKEQVGQWTEKY